MKLKYALKFMFVQACIVTTFLVLFTGTINLTLYYDTVVPVRNILRFPLLAFATVLPSLIFVRDKSKETKKGTIIRTTLHFIFTSGIGFGLVIHFGWLDATNAIFVIAFFLVIYIFTHIYQALRDRKLAKQLNERINAFHNAENATHRD